MNRARAAADTSLSEHIFALLALLALGLAVYGHLLVPGMAPYSAFSDIVPSHLAIKGVLWSEGWPALWRRDVMMGAPALTEPQALYLHPLQFLFWLLPPVRAFGPTLVLELVVAASGAYAFARVLGCGLQAALVAGVAQLVSFKWILAGYAGWSSVLAMLCLLPAIAAALLHLAQRPTPARALLLAGCLAVALSGATPQTLYYLLLVLGPCALVCARERAGSEALKLSALGVLALLLAIACTAYLWIPLVTELPLLARSDQHGYAYFLSRHGLKLGHLATLFWPEVLGTPLAGSYEGRELWEDAAYFGLLPLLGVCIATARVRSVPALRRALVVAFWMSLVLSLDSLVLELAFRFVPGYGVFRLPGRMLFVTAVLGVALAGCALDDLLRRSPARTAALVAASVAALIAIEGRVHATRYLRTVPEAELLAPKNHPVRQLAITPNARLAGSGRGAFNYGWAQEAGVRVLNGYGPYSFAHYKRYMDLARYGRWRDVPLTNWFDLREIARPDLLREAAVEWVVSLRPLSLSEFEPATRNDRVRGFVLYRGMSPLEVYSQRVRSPQSWARFATAVHPVASEVELAEAVRRERLTGQAFVLGLNATEARGLGGPGRVRVERAEAGFIRLRSQRSEPGLVVIAESWHPGWQARVSRRPAKVLQVNLNLLGVRVPGGDQRVELRFLPPHFELASSVSVAAVVLWLALSGRSLRRAFGRRAK